MTKIIAIGDLHGRDTWEKIVEKEKDADKIVFIGDYFDSFDISFDEQYKNYCRICAFKQEYPEQIILLIGNHEYHYLWWIAKEKYSGFQEKYSEKITQAIRNSITEGWLQMAYQEEQYLFTHAGVTQTWMDANYDVTKHEGNLADEINEIFSDCPEAFRFTASNPLDNTGDSITQSPIWVRPRALQSDAIEGFIQIIGHTSIKSPIFDSNLIMIDCFDHCNKYLAIIDGKPEVRTI